MTQVEEGPADFEVHLNASFEEHGLLSTGLQELEQLRLLLEGNSVVDWRRLSLRSEAEVDRLLRLQGFDPGDPIDQQRVGHIFTQAVEYLDRYFEFDLTAALTQLENVKGLFLMASGPDSPAQRQACRILKVMHVFHHLQGRELLFTLPVSAAELYQRIENKVFTALDGLKARGVRVAEFAGSRKTVDSMITKLLVQSESHAVQLHDRIRFRVITDSLDDLFEALVYLSTELFPFNYVVPGASRNGLIDLHRTIAADPQMKRFLKVMQFPEAQGPLPRSATAAPVNHFSGHSFKIINFVVDLPIRVDDLLARYNVPVNPEHGVVVFMLVEFQLCDQATAAANEAGENRHDLYKARQRVRVAQRLKGGADDDQG
ncbi:MAG: TIGR04552 family protein [Bradymonadia bacterium]